MFLKLTQNTKPWENHLFIIQDRDNLVRNNYERYKNTFLRSIAVTNVNNILPE